MSSPDLNPKNDAVLHIPGSLLMQIEGLAHKEHTDPAAIVDRALRSLRLLEAQQTLESIRKELPPTPYTPDDIPRLIREVRAEMRAEEELARRS